MIIFGVLFLLHLFIPTISYMFIFHLWPCILIVLGIEILISSTMKYDSFKYDTAAVFLVLVIAGFALCMGGADFVLQHAACEITF